MVWLVTFYMPHPKVSRPWWRFPKVYATSGTSSAVAWARIWGSAQAYFRTGGNP